MFKLRITNLKTKLLLVAGIGLISLICYIGFFVFFDKIDTLFNITAHTEIVSFQVVNKPVSRYNINNAAIHVTEDFDFKKIHDSFNGSLEINKDTHVKIERLSYGAIILELENATGNSVGNLYNNSNQNVYQANDYMLIEIQKVDSLLNQGTSIVFPLSGYVELGKSVDVEILNETSAVLRTGNITMTGYSSRGGGQYFEAGNKQLYLGDCLEFKDIEAIGFVAVNDDPALQVSYRIEAEEAVIIKPGPKSKNSGYRISASVYDRFVNDQLFQGFSLIFACILVLTSLIDFSMNIFKFLKKK